MAAMVNMTSLLNGKDSRWLQLEVCREFQRNKCSRQDTECKFAHPPANVEVQNGKVTACYDSIKGRCNRDKPPCKYFHPPQHLKDQLLINGRNHLALKNALMQQMGIAPGQPVIPGQVPQVATSPYLTGIPANTYSPYFAPGHLVPALLGPDPTTVSQLGPVVPQAVQVAQQKIPRSDRLEVCREFLRGACKRVESECRFAHPQESVARHDDGSITVCMDAVKGRCTRDPCRYFHPPLHLQAQLKAAQSRATAVAAAAATAPVSVSAATLTHHHQQQQQHQQHTQLQQQPPLPPPTIPNMPGSSLPATQQTNVANSAAAAANAAAVAALTLGQQQSLEVGKKRAADSDMFQLMDVKTVGSFYYENFAYSGMVPIKRPAAEKSGIPVYPGATTYQQLMQLQQPFVPVSCEYQTQISTSSTTTAPTTININCNSTTTTAAAASAATTATTTTTPLGANVTHHNHQHQTLNHLHKHQHQHHNLQQLYNLPNPHQQQMPPSTLSTNSQITNTPQQQQQSITQFPNTNSNFNHLSHIANNLNRNHNVSNSNSNCNNSSSNNSNLIANSNLNNNNSNNNNNCLSYINNNLNNSNSLKLINYPNTTTTTNTTSTPTTAADAAAAAAAADKTANTTDGSYNDSISDSTTATLSSTTTTTTATFITTLSNSVTTTAISTLTPTLTTTTAAAGTASKSSCTAAATSATFSNNYNSNDQGSDSENNNSHKNQDNENALLTSQSISSSSSLSSSSTSSCTSPTLSTSAYKTVNTTTKIPDDVNNKEKLNEGITTSTNINNNNYTSNTQSSSESFKYYNGLSGDNCIKKAEENVTNGSLATNTSLNGSANSFSSASYVNGYPTTTSQHSAGILPTPPVSSSVVTNAYQAQQNMQRLYQQSYNAAVANSPYANMMASYGHQTPVSSTSVSPYTSQTITVPSYSYAGTTPTSYAYSAYPSAAQVAAAAAPSHYYADAAALAKEVAQKSYANAIKAANANASTLTGKPLTAAAAAYSGMALNKAYMAAPGQQVMTPHAAFMQAQAQAQAHAHAQAHQQQQQQAAVAAMANAQMRSYGAMATTGMTSSVGTPVHGSAGATALLPRPPTGAGAYLQANPSTALLRGQPMTLSTASNAQYAAAMQQQQQQAAFFFPGMMTQASGYPFAAMGAIPTAAGLPAGLTPTAQLAAATASSAAGANSALVLNPYKKMKTS